MATPTSPAASKQLLELFRKEYPDMFRAWAESEKDGILIEGEIIPESQLALQPPPPTKETSDVVNISQICKSITINGS